MPSCERTLAERRCRELAEAGANYFEVSMDYWHLPYVSLDRVRNLLCATRNVGITIILRTLSSRSHKISELMSEFTDDELSGVRIMNSRVEPVGRGATTIPVSEIYMASGPEGCCANMLNLTVTPNGNI
jgi:hypothetical protein